MNYWLLTTEYPPHYGGGISTYCFHTARMLSESGHAVTVFVPDERVRDFELAEEDGIRVLRFNSGRTGLEGHLGHLACQSYAFACIVRDRIRKVGKPDCIESQEYLAIPYYILQFKLLQFPEFSGVPILLTLHSPAFLYLEYNREAPYQFPHYWIGEMEKSCMRSADLVLSPSRYMTEEIKRYFPLDDARVQVLHNPYPVSGSSPIDPVIARNTLVFYGKLSPQKGVFELFAYLKELWDNGFSHSLTVIGGMEKVYYPEMKTLGQLIKEKYATYLKKGLIRFIGKIDPSKRDEYLADAHVILVPSLNDNLPYACIEAMSIGKIVLASVQGGQAELIEDGVNGFLFDHRVPETFGKQLDRILSLDDETLQRIGKAARERIRSLLSYERIYQQKSALINGFGSQSAAPARFPFTNPPFSDKQPERVDGNPGLLTVVIPYFNMGAYIHECVDSVLASDYAQIEILVVDDGSTEPKDLDVLEKLERTGSIRVFHKKNEGLAATRNYGARMARGEYLAFLDADDKVHAAYYKKAILILEQYRNVFFVGAWVRFFGSKRYTWITWNPEPPYILLHNSVNSSSLVYKKSAFLEGGRNDGAVDYGIEDYESVINMLSHGFRGVVIPECLFFYRIRKNSMYRSLTRYKILYSYQYISTKHREFYNNFGASIFNLLNANGPSFAYDNPSFETPMASRSILPRRILNRLRIIIKGNPHMKRVALRVIKLLKLR